MKYPRFVLSAQTLALISVLASSTSNAGEYSFGGGCPSQGAWTQIALSQTQSITAVVNQLKNNPACKGIESVLGDLTTASSLLENPKEETNQNKIGRASCRERVCLYV